MNQNFLDTAVSYIEVTSAFTKRAADEITLHRQGQEKAASMRPTVLKLMLDNNVIAPQQKEAAEAMLGGHAETLGLLSSAVEKIAELNAIIEKSKTGLGGPDDSGTGSTKKAGDNGEAYDSLGDNFVGRPTSEKKASDRALEAVLQTPRR